MVFQTFTFTFLYLIFIISISPILGTSQCTDLTGSVFTFQNDIRIRTFCGAQEEFDINIGAGGAISALYDIQNNNTALIGPEYIWESTDRIFQWVWWDGIKVPISGIPDDRYNINQGGNSLGGTLDSAGKFARIMQVYLKTKKLSVEVYSVQDNQFYPQLDQHIKSKISAYTQYQIDGGDIRIRRVFLIGDTEVDDVETDLKGSYIEAWTPMNAAQFDAMALQLGPTGDPLWWYRYNHNISYYPQIPVANTHGYSVAYSEVNSESNVAVGLAFGNKNPNIGIYNFNSMEWQQGTKFIGMLPGIQTPSLKKRTVIDMELFLIPLRKLDADAVKRLEDRSAEVKAPMVYQPNDKLTRDLRKIVKKLKKNQNKNGIRTNHLAPLIKS